MRKAEWYRQGERRDYKYDKSYEPNERKYNETLLTC